MSHFDVAKKIDYIAELEHKMSAPNFWDKQEEAQKVSQEATNLKDEVETWQALKNKVDDVKVIWEIAMEEDDSSLEDEIKDVLQTVQSEIERLELNLLLGSEYDANNAILSIHAGAGGTEAQDWAQMLLRMYTRYCEKVGFKASIVDFQDGDEAGVKSVTMQINGQNAYGYLKAEKGVHRLVRISPFDSNARRHTSFAAIDVMPEIDDDVEINLDASEIKVDTYRASGAGGQHINKTDSAVRMTHMPTGIVVQCQSQRSQIQNREVCLQLLRAKLFELEQQKKADLKSEISGNQQAIEWGSQIRSYVFHPYNLVKDHRTNVETGNVQSVMDGELDKFIEGYLRSLQIKH